MREEEKIVNDNHFQAQFAALKDQISPHFLFNSLSVLASLVRKDPDLSEQFIDHLARAYRYILEHKDDERVSLSDEMDFARSYAFLLEVRFRRKFRVTFPPQEACRHFTLLPFTLQLLIENAIRHNRMSATEPLLVEMLVGEASVLTVRNNRQLRTQPEGDRRLGLANIRHRYALLTGLPVNVDETDKQFAVQIPLLRTDR
ncbi:sensor histidine kinase [Tellurirhabdus rosea]|uniref:sensor histidine kinase n=1 Tax=Tellurirhabdus rosea TaxID=2674997 RepID=UPI002259EE32|nr:histidine kinase [Tellurirhabdus rosea]